MYLRLAVTVLLLCLDHSSRMAAAQDTQAWNRFRGPNGSGLSSARNIPAVWQPGDYRWQAELPGIGHSSPVVWQGKLFVTSADEETGTRFVHCLAATDGKLLWTHKHPAIKHKKHQRNSFASSTPAVDADFLYVCWATPQEFVMLALDHGGTEVWRRDLAGFKAGHGYGTSPIVVEDLVVLANDQDQGGYLIALDRTSGQTRWKLERRKTRTPYSTPCVYRPDGQPPALIFSDWEHGITAVDARTGRQLWEIDVFGKDQEKRSIGSPIVAGDLVIATCAFTAGKKYVVAVHPTASHHGPVEVTEVYRIERGAPHIPTVLAKDDLLFLWADNGIVTCCDLASGKHHWQQRVGGNFSGSPICIGEQLVCIAENGEVVVLAASKKFELLGRSELGQPSRSTPAAAEGMLFLRTYSHLFAIGGD